MNKIATFRLNNNFTQKELAEKAQISREHLSALEKDKYIPNVRTLNKLASALNCKIDDLI